MTKTFRLQNWISVNLLQKGLLKIAKQSIFLFFSWLGLSQYKYKGEIHFKEADLISDSFL